ncbi:RagB/SusD family nutrient uptake outer membrane protein [Proteiniphilum acetatigenes]|uniref:RagB/SusD family nutrient uptake outer membrane protein n=1 Tax=Proteiniphilum acetatigenes TaxID=294710 RepID=UPI00035D1F2D|nr:RagB/SusD family nutrient uptake outer membrane protein [Proteiniphilum acetatigenes]
MKRLKIITLITLVLVFTGCSDFLEPEPRERYTEMDAWKSVENTYLYINGFYKPIYEYGPYGQKYADVSMHDGFSDILRYGANVMGGAGGDVNKVVYTGTISPSSNILSDYNYEYNRIRRINEFLYGLKTYAKYDENVVTLMEAQARFFRAYLHFMLVRNHGSIVIRDNIDGPNEAFKARSAESECWDFIEKDLDFAAENLPEEWDKDNFGRLTQGAVYGFKSRAMLYARRWDKAAEAAQKVIDKEGTLYDLLPEYADVFKQPDLFKETVLGYRFHGQLTHSIQFDKLYSPSGDFDPENTDVKCLAVPTQEMIDSYYMADGSKFDWNNPEHAANPYQNREPRFYASVLYNGAPWKGRTIETFVGGKDGFKEFGTENHPNTTTTGYYIRKLLDEQITDMTRRGTTAWSEVRYAEVLLNQAEALNESGKSNEALNPLNKVRRRAKLPDITETNQANLRQIIREERKIELAFEGQRYWDLRRWRTALDILGGKRMHGMKITKNADDTFTYEIVDCDGQNRFFEERYYQFPIPLSEIQNNPECKQIDKW